MSSTLEKLGRILLLILFTSFAAIAQNNISREVFSNGGGPMSSAASTVNGTFGQTIVGVSSATSGNISSGFWPQYLQPDSIAILPSLPLAIGAATAQVWNDQIYLFGGSSDWWAAAIYDDVYRLENTAWVSHNTIPDANNWGRESVIADDNVYLFNGYTAGAGSAQSFHLPSGAWTDLPRSNNWVQWGNTVAVEGDNIYLINIAFKTWQYSIPDSAWASKSDSPKPGLSGMRSVTVNGEIYVIGFQGGEFHKYSPDNDQWSQLASPPYIVAGCAMEFYKGKIYCVGGSNDGTPDPNNTYQSIISYDISSDTWTTETEEISSPRLWMASAIYQNQFYVIGGFDALGLAVDKVEAIAEQPLVSVETEETPALPEAFGLEQNYPNPFNPTTTIHYALPEAAEIRLTIHNVLGERVRSAVSGRQPAGFHQYVWDGRSDTGEQVASGMYFYRLSAKQFTFTRKMLLIR